MEELQEEGRKRDLNKQQEEQREKGEVVGKENRGKVEKQGSRMNG